MHIFKHYYRNLLFQFLLKREKVLQNRFTHLEAKKKRDNVNDSKISLHICYKQVKKINQHKLTEKND